MMSNKNYLSGLFITLLLAAGFIMSAITMSGIRSEAAPLKPAPVIKGEWSSLYEDLYNKNLHSFDVSKNIWGTINYAAFREGMDGVIISRSGWLFTNEEFESQKNAAENFTRNMTYIKDVAQSLQQKNIALLVVPVPAKARIYAHELGPYRYPAYKNEIYSNFLSTLKQNNIHTLDTLAVMRSAQEKEGAIPLFLKTDTHWSPKGAALTAKAVAQYIEREDIAPLDAPERYASAPMDVKPFSGDLMRYVPVGMFAPYVRLPEDRLVTYRTEIVADESGGGENDGENGSGEADLSAALFDSNIPSATLVGTSYSANENWNFNGFLKAALHRDILNAADEGLGPFETMKKYLSDASFTESPPELIIWEIPERFLTFEYNLSNPSEKE